MAAGPSSTLLNSTAISSLEPIQVKVVLTAPPDNSCQCCDQAQNGGVVSVPQKIH